MKTINNSIETPDWLCQIMVNMIPQGVKEVLEPTPGKGNLVRVLKTNGYEVIAPEKFENLNNSYQCIVMNPPFTPSALAFEIFFSCLGKSDSIIAIMPWSILNSDRRMKYLQVFGLVQFCAVSRNSFGPSSRGGVLLILQRHHTEPTIFRNIFNPSIELNLDSRLWYKAKEEEIERTGDR